MIRTMTHGNHSLFKMDLASEKGMTLIELVVSIAVFLVVSSGIAGAMIIGLRSTSDAQLATMGKDRAQQQIEEIDAKPYYVPFSDDPTEGTTANVDLLDTYYPDSMFGNFTDDRGWQGWYTEAASDAFFTLVSPADERGIVTTVQTRFKDENGNTIAPPTTYNSNDYGMDYPPSELLEITVITTWQTRNGGDNYTLTTRKSASRQTINLGSLE